MELVNGIYNIDKKQFEYPFGEDCPQKFTKLSRYVEMALKGLGDNTVSALEVAKALYVIRELKLYQDYPIPNTDNRKYFADFPSFCQYVFHCGRSTIFNYVALYERFGVDSNQSTELPIPSEKLSSFTYSQLLLMLPLSDSELLSVTPAMTCNEIKKYVKECKENREKSKRLDGVINEDAEVIEPVEEFEDFALNNDERRLAFLDTYKRWIKCAECDVVNTHVTFYDVCLVDGHHLVAVSTTSDVFDAVSYYLFDTSQVSPGVYTNYCCHFLDMRWATSQNEIIKFLRDRKIKSIKIKSEQIRENK